MKKTLIIILSALLAASAAGCKKTEANKHEASTQSAVSETLNKEKIDSGSDLTEIKATESNTEKPENHEEETIAVLNNEIQNQPDNSEESSSAGNNADENDNYSETNNGFNAADAIYQSGMDMYSKVLLGCPYMLDYDSADQNGFVLISDPEVTGIDDIVSLYCTIFDEPNSYIYERYTENNGRVYCNDASRGANIYYTGTDLEYISGDDSEMTFNAVSHYSDPETGEAMEDKTAAFTIKLVNGSYKITEFDYPK